MKGRHEGEVKAGIQGYLNLRGDLFFQRANTGGMKKNDAYVKFNEPGTPDFICCQAPTGRFVGVEVKREHGGVVSEDQRRWGKQLEAHGGKYVVARSVEDVEAALGPPSVRIPKKTGRVYPR